MLTDECLGSGSFAKRYPTTRSDGCPFNVEMSTWELIQHNLPGDRIGDNGRSFPRSVPPSRLDAVSGDPSPGLSEFMPNVMPNHPVR